MERVETLLKKLQEQFAQNAPAGQLLLTVQMLQAELNLLSAANAPDLQNSGVVVTLSQNPVFAAREEIVSVVEEAKPIVEEEKIIEVLQVDEAEIEAELEEIKACRINE